MDNAVALVETYLRVNGYFTVGEYPVLDVPRRGPAQMMTDLDILAVRLAPATQGGSQGRPALDPALGASPEQSDMIVGEVKEGAPRLNRALREPKALRAALTRFGCCTPGDVDDVVDGLRRHGKARTSNGHTVRVVVFANPHGPRTAGPWHTVALDHVVSHLQEHVRSNWDEVGHTEIKDPTLGLLALIEKSSRAGHHAGARS
jgi:hypothetical protein